MEPSLAGPTGPRSSEAVPADDAAALLGLGEHALLDGIGRNGEEGQVGQVARESIVARPPSLREPPPYRGLTFGTRTALSPR